MEFNVTSDSHSVAVALFPKTDLNLALGSSNSIASFTQDTSWCSYSGRSSSTVLCVACQRQTEAACIMSSEVEVVVHDCCTAMNRSAGKMALSMLLSDTHFLNESPKETPKNMPQIPFKIISSKVFPINAPEEKYPQSSIWWPPWNYLQQVCQKFGPKIWAQRWHLCQ